MTGEQMDAYIYRGAGGTEVIEQTRREVPEPAAGEVLVRTAAFGLNRADVQQRRGYYPPPSGASDIPGLEASGTIVGVGPGVTRWQIGDRVAALLSGGGYAQYIAVPEGQLLPVPAGMDLVAAAAIPEVTCTVVSNLFLEGDLRNGQSVLIHGGAGGIGSMAIQLAKDAGATVYSTASDAGKLQHCHALGADHGINYRAQDFSTEIDRLTEGRGVDLILDVVGAKYLTQNVSALAEGGQLVIIGLQGGAKAELNIGQLMSKRARIIGTTLRSRSVAEKSEIVRHTIDRIRPLLETGTLDLSVGATFEFDELREAQDYFDSGEHRGKILVRAPR